MGVLADIGDAVEALLASEGSVRAAADDPFGELHTALVREHLQQSVRVDVGSIDGLRAVDTSSTYGSLLSVGQPHLGARAWARRRFLRDMVTVLPMSEYSMLFPREMAPLDSSLAASGVPEGSTKPDVAGGMTFDPVTVTPGTIAANMTPSTQLVADSQTFTQYVQQRMPYLLAAREENACINGNGEPVNAGIVGLRNDPDIEHHSYAGTLPEMIGTAAEIVGARGGYPSLVIVSTTRFWSGYVSNPTFFSSLPDGVPLRYLLTPAMPWDEVIVGDPDSAYVLDRNQTRLDAYPQHADYASRGLTLLQAERRVGWVVDQPWAWEVVSSA